LVNPNYYTYAYLREDKTLYYIGKGQGNRAFVKRKRGFSPPQDLTRILFLKQNLTEEEAFKHEVYMIDVFGRKDLGTGILHNRTNGGEGTSGCIPSEEAKRKMSKVRKGVPKSEETKKKISEANKDRILSEEHKRKIGEANKNPSEEIRKRKSEAKKGKKHPNYGKKWWNDGCGNIKFMVECPGDGWQLGRK